MRAELHEEKAPGTPDISISKPRKKLMRARDSIGVAKYHMGKKITRDESIGQSPSRSVRVTRDLGTPTTPSGRSTRSQSKKLETRKTGDTANATANNTRTSTKITRNTTQVSVLIFFRCFQNDCPVGKHQPRILLSHEPRIFQKQIINV